MKKSLTKRALSLVLCVVMLVSCWVFTAPSASATDYTGPSSTYGDRTPVTNTTGPTPSLSGTYRVRIIVREGNSFDNSIHDNANYVEGITYGLNNSKRKLNGTSTSDDNNNYWCEYAQIKYKTMNGTGTEGCVWFNVGDKDYDGRDNIISSWGTNYGYFPSADGVVIDGFPTSATVRYYNTKSGNNKGGFTFAVQVATWSTSTKTWTWSKNYISGAKDNYGTYTGKNIFGAWNNFDTNYYGGITAGECAAHKFNEDQEFKGEVDISNSAYPVAQSTPSVTYTNDATAVCPKSATATAVSRSLSYSDPLDQYGTKMASQITTKTNQDVASGFTQSGKTTTINYGANVPGNTDKQTFTATVTWNQKVTGSQKSASATLTVYDYGKTTSDGTHASNYYTVNWKKYDGTNNAFDPDTKQIFGHTPTKTDSDVPDRDNVTVGKTVNSVRYTYDSDFHYYGKTWKKTTDSSALSQIVADVTYKATDTFAAHDYKYSRIEDAYKVSDATCDEPAHYAKSCICGKADPNSEVEGHYFTNGNPLGHDFTKKTVRDGTTEKVAPTCTTAGEYYCTCSRCGAVSNKLYYTVDDDGEGKALGHTFKLAQTKAEDGQQGYIYYECERVESCGKYCYASYDAETGKYSKVNEENPVNYSDITSDPQTANKIPAPLFNDRETSENIYQRFDYSKRQASFKYMSGEEIGKQTVRFAGSVKIPEGISYENTQEDNNIIDFGFVYTQEPYILDENGNPDPNKLVFCEDEFCDSERKTNYDYPSEAGYRVYKMSLAENNPSSTDISNWEGCTPQESGNVTGVDYITFNLVVNVNAKNWHKNYVCRPYIVYNFRGKVYTVYDAGTSNGETKYFCRSIASLTNDIMKSDMLFNVDTPVYYDSQEFSLEDFMKSIFVDEGYDYDDYCSFAQRYINDKDYVETRIIDYYLETYDESDEERAGTVSLFKNGNGWLSSTDAYNILHDENSDIMNLFNIV